MKKIKLIIIFIIFLIGGCIILNKSEAVSISTEETPQIVECGNEFEIILKFNEKIKLMNAHIKYDENFVTMLEDNENKDVSINSKYSANDLSLMYIPLKQNVTEDVFKIKAKALDVEEEKNVKFQIYDLTVVTDSESKKVDDIEVNLTIKRKEENEIQDVQTNKIDAGVFEDLFGLEQRKILAISPRSGFYMDFNDKTKNKLYLNDLEMFCQKNSISIVSVNNKNVTDKNDTILKTGDVLKDNNNIEYELVLFGDVDKNGSVCTAGDLYTVKKALLSLENNKNFDKLQRLAADVRYQTKSDGSVLLDRNGLTVLNAFDLSRMRLKALGYDGHYNIESDRLSGTLIYESIYRYSE